MIGTQIGGQIGGTPHVASSFRTTSSLRAASSPRYSEAGGASGTVASTRYYYRLEPLLMVVEDALMLADIITQYRV